MSHAYIELRYVVKEKVRVPFSQPFIIFIAVCAVLLPDLSTFSHAATLSAERDISNVQRVACQFLAVLRSQNIDGLLALLPNSGPIELGPDYGMTKQELAKELRSRYG